MRRCDKFGFTLIELLVVITIIGILVGLLMPAVTAAREAARRAQCLNNIKQMAAACLGHESKYRTFPTGGWGYQYAGDAGGADPVTNEQVGTVDRNQPGGWHYNILPFLEMQDLHDMGKNEASAQKKSDGWTRAATPIQLFICPTRHRLQTFPRGSAAKAYLNITEPTSPNNLIGRSDYAANAGDNPVGVTGGMSYMDCAKNTTCQKAEISPPQVTVGGITTPALNGVVYVYSEVTMASVKDGPTYTYLLGERYICPDNYFNGNSPGNNQGWDAGYGYDGNRWTQSAPLPDGPGYPTYSGTTLNGRTSVLPPAMATAGFAANNSFGSAHTAGFNMAFCDGHAKRISYSIDAYVHRSLGNRCDGNKNASTGHIIDFSEIEK